MVPGIGGRTGGFERHSSNEDGARRRRALASRDRVGRAITRLGPERGPPPHLYEEYPELSDASSLDREYEGSGGRQWIQRCSGWEGRRAPPCANRLPLEVHSV